MKKVLVVLLIATFVGAFAFADGITFGAWGRSGFIFKGGTGPDLVDMGPGGGRVGFNIHGTSPNVGFDLNVDSTGASISIGDNARVWVKPADFLKFDFGQSQGDALRGKIGDDWAAAWAQNSYQNMYEAGDEDTIFTRFYPKMGVLTSITPVEGLYIGAAIDSKGNPKISEAVSAMQVGVGYTIKDVGQVRVQYIGAKNLLNTQTYIQGAFALTALKGLTIDLGTKLPINGASAAPSEQSTVILAASFSDSGFSATAKAKVLIGTNVGFGAYGDVAYNISGPFTAGIKVGFNGETNNTSNVDLMPYVKLGYSNGFIALGFLYKDGYMDTAQYGGGPYGKYSVWSIPLFAEYWF